MRRLLIALTLAAGCSSALSPDGARDLGAAGDLAARPLNVLFVGNSYTFVNDLPGRVRAVAASVDGPSITVEQVAVGGATMQQHWSATGARDRIEAGGWTHVVLQGQSAEPLWDPQNFQFYARALADAARGAGATPLFFETWARQEGNPLYAEAWTGRSPKAMQAGLRAAYEKAAMRGMGALARVGDAWEAALASSPPPPLFDPDGSHPSQHGTYLAACVIYRALTGRPATGLGALPPGVSDDEAALFQKLADETR